MLPWRVDIALRWPLLGVLLFKITEQKVEDIFPYRKVDAGRTYGPEDRCCLFLTGPVWPAVSEGVMFIRSSKVAIANTTVENAKNERRDQGGMTGG